MIKKISLIAITFFFITALFFSDCASIKSPPANDIESKLLRYMDNYYNKHEFSGTVLITRDDKVLLNKGYGKADFSRNINNITVTEYCIA